MTCALCGELMKPRRLGRDFWDGKPVCDACQEDVVLLLGGCKDAACDGWECCHFMRDYTEAEFDAEILRRIEAKREEAAKALQGVLL